MSDSVSSKTQWSNIQLSHQGRISRRSNSFKIISINGPNSVTSTTNTSFRTSVQVKLIPIEIFRRLSYKTTMVKFDQENLRASPVLRSASPPKDIPGIVSSKQSLFKNSPSKYSTSHILNFTKVSMEGKNTPGTCRLRKPSATIARVAGIPVGVLAEKQKLSKSSKLNRNVMKKAGVGERIVDFLCFSHDVLLHRILLSFDGELEIKDHSFNSLRTVSSATGQFHLHEPLMLEAHKFYRIYLKSRFNRVTPNRGTSWQSHFGDMTMEWGHCAVLGGMDLLISS